MTPHDLIQVFLAERDQLDAVNYPLLEEGEAPNSESRKLKLATYYEKRYSIAKSTNRNALSLLSTVERENLALLASHFCQAFFNATHPTKRMKEVKERIKNYEEKVRLAGIKKQQVITLLRSEADRAREARRKGADAIHAENRAMKADVFVWLNTNMVNFKSMDSAAQAITRLQPIAFRTARAWTGEWKKLRSAGTP